MLFNTFNFFIFFIIVFSLNFAFRNKPIFRYTILLIASYFFYAYWNAYYLIIIIVSTLIDFTVGILLEHSNSKQQKRALLVLSVVINLSILGIFKYYNFFIDSIYTLFVNIGIPFQYSSLELLLPVGISFYTFQSISYIIDIYKGEIKAERDPIRYALYIAFFPQLVAGPIVRAKDFLPQFSAPFSLTKKEFFLGTTLVWIGIAKKSIFADFFGKYSDRFFENLSGGGASSIYDMLLGIYSFAMQIYFDFSGYTDTAIGVALLLGFKIQRNFFYPYAATSMSDFWHRWHISLSSWFKDYLYIPLGGNRKNHNKNILTTLTLSGIWHGAAWHFALWGFIHAIFLIIEKQIKRFISLPTIIKRLIVFHLVCVGWLVFRVESILDLLLITNHLSLSKEFVTIGEVVAFAGIFLIISYQHNHTRFTIATFIGNRSYPVQAILHAIIATMVIALGSFSTPFIYFQF